MNDESFLSAGKDISLTRLTLFCRGRKPRPRANLSYFAFFSLQEVQTPSKTDAEKLPNFEGR